MSTSILKFDVSSAADRRLAGCLVMNAIANLRTAHRRVAQCGSLIVLEFGTPGRAMHYPLSIPGYADARNPDEQAIAAARFLSSAEFQRLLDEGDRLADALMPVRFDRGDDYYP